MKSQFNDEYYDESEDDDEIEEIIDATLKEEENLLRI